MSYDVAGARRASDGRSLRDIVSERLVAHGGWCMIPSAFAAEVVSAAGCDWLCIDTQHGLIDDAAMRGDGAGGRDPRHARARFACRGTSRHRSCARSTRERDGVIVPMVNSADDARLAVAASKYPPLGVPELGAGPLRHGPARLQPRGRATSRPSAS